MKDFPFKVHPKNEDELFMLEALKEAWKAYHADEVPIGAVLVKEGKVIARGHNQVEMLQDATAHSEMLCITAGAFAVSNWRLSDTTLYCTVEPCLMCAGALFLSRVSTLVWGTPDKRHGANGSFVNVLDTKHPTHKINIRKGVLAENAAFLLQDFFQKKRLSKSNGFVSGKSVEPLKQSNDIEKVHDLMDELVNEAKKKLLKMARVTLPYLTEEDILQPNDYQELEFNPHFRYEEGYLAGLQSAQMAIKAIK